MEKVQRSSATKEPKLKTNTSHLNPRCPVWNHNWHEQYTVWTWSSWYKPQDPIGLGLKNISTTWAFKIRKRLKLLPELKGAAAASNMWFGIPRLYQLLFLVWSIIYLLYEQVFLNEYYCSKKNDEISDHVLEESRCNDKRKRIDTCLPEGTSLGEIHRGAKYQTKTKAWLCKQHKEKTRNI